jgi:hypothetical protein
VIVIVNSRVPVHIGVNWDGMRPTQIVVLLLVDYNIKYCRCAFVDGMGGRCNAPMDPGFGNILLARWFFNRMSGNCEAFLYRGMSQKGNV